MVTAGRVRLARRAVRCFHAQTWANRELVVVDDGPDDYAPMLAAFDAAGTVRYERIQPRPGERLLGGLRNIALELARGDYCIQWDDDEWYHPDRIAAQMHALEGGAGASVLRDTLMHLDDDGFVDHPYRTALRRGTPGSILHRRTSRRYPNWSRGEDSAFRDALREEMKVAVVRGASHLFIRCFHGANTWHRRHFVERLHYTAADALHYAVARYVRRNLLTHPAFRLTPLERASVEAFLRESREMGCFGRYAQPSGLGL